MSSGEIITNVFFYIFALAALAGAVAVAASKNIVRSAFALLAVLFSTAAFYAFLRADFIAAAQVIIYVGGILVLIIFAVMLTHRITDVKLSNDSAHGPAGFFASVCLLFALVVVMLTHVWRKDHPAAVVEIQPSMVTGGSPLSLLVALVQTDGRTPVAPGEVLFEGRGTLSVGAASLPPGLSAVRVWLLKAAGGEWKACDFKVKGRAMASRDVVLRPSAKGLRGEVELQDLERGRYRIRLSLLLPSAEGAPSEAGVVHPARPAGVDCDFQSEQGLTRPIGMALMTRYLLPFEIVSVLLLAALIGAAFLARKEVKR